MLKQVQHDEQKRYDTIRIFTKLFIYKVSYGTTDEFNHSRVCNLEC